VLSTQIFPPVQSAFDVHSFVSPGGVPVGAVQKLFLQMVPRSQSFDVTQFFRQPPSVQTVPLGQPACPLQATGAAAVTVVQP
jgi:hypothetical protein